MVEQREDINMITELVTDSTGTYWITTLRTSMKVYLATSNSRMGSVSKAVDMFAADIDRAGYKMIAYPAD